VPKKPSVVQLEKLDAIPNFFWVGKNIFSLGKGTLSPLSSLIHGFIDFQVRAVINHLSWDRAGTGSPSQLENCRTLKIELERKTPNCVREMRRENSTMSERELTALLRSKKRGNSKRGWRCPDDNKLAAYVNGQLANERKSFEAHFANCTTCLETLSFLAQSVDEPLEAVPANLLARARSLGDKKPVVVWRWRWAMATAAACVLIFALLAVWRSRVQDQSKPTDLVALQRQPERPNAQLPSVVQTPAPQPTAALDKPVQPPHPTESRAPVVRGSEDQLKPTVVFPQDGTVVKLGQQPLRWKLVADASFYEVKIVSEDGSAVVTESTNNAEFQIDKPALQPGHKYFVKIVAHLTGGRTVTSGPVSFRVAAP
jgi:hypothetical protein